MAIEGGESMPVVVAESSTLVVDSHAAGLLERIERLLAEAGWEKLEIDAFVATRGPGSFTGIRVGLGLLAGLGLATGRPCFGVTTLEALVGAYGPADRDRVAVIAAGRGELYGCRFDPAGWPPVAQEPPWAGSEQSALERYSGAQVILIPAPGTELFAKSTVAPAPRGIAAAAARLVAFRHPGLAAPAPPLTPVYVRPPDVRLRPTR